MIEALIAAARAARQLTVVPLVDIEIVVTEIGFVVRVVSQNPRGKATVSEEVTWPELEANSDSLMSAVYLAETRRIMS